MCLAQGQQRSDAGKARTRGPSVSSQALNHSATALPFKLHNARNVQNMKPVQFAQVSYFVYFPRVYHQKRINLFILSSLLKKTLLTYSC